MPLDPSTFEYLKPSDTEMEAMAQAREAAKTYASVVDRFVHEGPDKTYILRELRTLAMWVNVAITRDQNGRPRT